MSTNTMLSILVVVLGTAIILLLYYRAKMEKSDDPERDKLTFDKYLEIAKLVTGDIVKGTNVTGITGHDYLVAKKRQAQLETSLRLAPYGIETHKIRTTAQLKRVLEDLCNDEDDLCEVTNFRADYLSPQTKWEILLYFYMRDHGKNALKVMIYEYELDRPRYIIEDGTVKSYIITADDIHQIYSEKVMSNREMIEEDRLVSEYMDSVQITSEDIRLGRAHLAPELNRKKWRVDRTVMADLISKRGFSVWKGFGDIDTLQEMNIDGFSIGCSGSVLSALLPGRQDQEWTASRSAWLYFEGKEIHLSFIDFGSEDEVYRIVTLLGRYGRSSPLTARSPYKISSMWNQSRVLSIRPNAGEYPAAFVRKFTLPRIDMDYLLVPRDKEGNPLVKNEQLIVGLIKYMMAGQVTTVITGMQGTGKTTAMMGWIKYIPATLTLRTLETVFELRARELYPQRNIFAGQETENIRLKELQDAFKKSNAGITMVGEIATDDLAADFIQNTQVSSPFSIASHHGMSEWGMIYGLGGSLSAIRNISLERAIKQVVEAVKCNAHLGKTEYKEKQVRYYAYFSEIVPIIGKRKLPIVDNPLEKNISLEEMQKQKTYFDYAVKVRELEDEAFKVNRIAYFDKEDMTYKADNWFTEELTIKMYNTMDPEMREGFLEFVETNWGKSKAA